MNNEQLAYTIFDLVEIAFERKEDRNKIVSRLIDLLDKTR